MQLELTGRIDQVRLLEECRIQFSDRLGWYVEATDPDWGAVAFVAALAAGSAAQLPVVGLLQFYAEANAAD